jgi:hypothetical protein
MKKLFPLGTFIFVLALGLMAFTNSEPTQHRAIPPQQQKTNDYGWPDDIMALFKNSCFDCHTTGSDNAKARSLMNLSNWKEWSDAKKVGKFHDMCEKLEKGKMPPEKFIEKNPQKAWTPEQTERFCKWSEEESKKLMGE